MEVLPESEANLKLCEGEGVGLLAAVSARSVRSAAVRAVARTSTGGVEESVEGVGWEMPPFVWVSRKSLVISEYVPGGRKRGTLRRHPP